MVSRLPHASGRSSPIWSLSRFCTLASVPSRLPLQSLTARSSIREQPIRCQRVSFLRAGSSGQQARSTGSLKANNADKSREKFQKEISPIFGLYASHVSISCYWLVILAYRLLDRLTRFLRPRFTALHRPLSRIPQSAERHAYNLF